jgi:hypothetical protein
MDTTSLQPDTIHAKVPGAQPVLPEGETRSEAEDRANALIAKASKLGAYLRNAGSLMLVLSALAFMLQKWGIIDHITRYFSFLGFTGVMAASALLCGLGVKEGKSARTLFGLVVALTPVHFAQLGGLIFSVFGEIPRGTSYPTYLLWQAESSTAVLATVGIALCALAPILFVGFSTLDRSLAKQLTAASLIANTILLAPTRDPNMIALLSGTTLLAVLLYNVKLKGMAKYVTRESIFARATLFLPVAVVVGRQMTLYSLSEGFLAINLLFLAGVLFAVVPKYVGERLGALSQTISSIPVILGVATAISSLGIGAARDDFWIFLLSVSVPTTVLLLIMSILSQGAYRNLQTIAALVGLSGTLVAFNFHPGVTTSALTLVAVVTFFTIAFMMESKSVLGISGVAGILATIYHVQILLQTFEFNLWITLGSVGVVTIVAASILERHFTAIAQQLGMMRGKIAQWQR